jgi:hypothetical protein
MANLYILPSSNNISRYAEGSHVPKPEKYVPRFETDGADLYVDGHRILKAWVSLHYPIRWYGVKKREIREISPEDGKRRVKDMIWYCLIEGRNDYYDWDHYSQKEISSEWYAMSLSKKEMLKTKPSSTKWI